MNLPTKYLNKNTDGVTVFATTGANTPETWFEFTVPRGIACVFQGIMDLVLKLRDSAGNELPNEALIYVGIKTPDDPDRVKPIGVGVPYEPWGNLSITQQQDADFRDRCRIDLGVPYIAVNEEETLVFQVKSNVGVTPANVQFRIPYKELSPGDPIFRQILAHRKSLLRF